ncbi:MAG: PAS domain S-box protein [Ferruginibacter sp.]|nr:PAS domain S-box protein [Rhodoferax sp.]
MVVEGNSGFALRLQLKLTQLGYTVIGPAAEARESMVLAAEMRPDIALVNLRLPGTMDGVALALSLQTQFSLPVVVLSTFGDEETISRARLTEPLGFIQKPFSRRELRAVLELAMYKHLAKIQLHASEKRFRTIFDAGPEAMKLLSSSGELLEMNRAGLAMCETDSLDAVRAYGLDQFVDPAYQEGYRVLHQCALAGVPGMLEYQATGLHGTRRWLETHTAPIRDAAGQVTMTLTITHETTERKTAEAALRLSDLSLKAISEGVVITDRDQNILVVNAAFEAITGYTRVEILGKNCRFLQGPLTDWPTVTTIRLTLKQFGHFAGEVLNYRKDGTVFWNDLSISPVRNAQGVTTHFIGITRDVTTRKTTELALRESARQLQATSQRVLEAQETERRRVAHELHDELGQALTAIKINLQVSERFQGQSPKELNAENIRIVEGAMQHVRSLALALRPSMLDDLGLLPALRWLADQTASRSGFTVQVHHAIPPDRLPPSVETACFRIVQEALTNVARHSHASTVEIDLFGDGDALVLSVYDNGCGFNVEEMRARGLAGGSMGMLGMQERAALIGGHLEIQSNSGQGSTLRLRCPLRKI